LSRASPSTPPSYFSSSRRCLVLLVTWYVAGPLAGGLITAVIGVIIGGLWFAVPLVSRHGAVRLCVSAECFGFALSSNLWDHGHVH
jgi:hypothetical protein